MGVGSSADALAMPRPDAVVMDHRPGEEIGDAAIVRLPRHCNTPRLPAVRLTGGIDPEVAARAEGNAMRLLHEPVDTNRLRATPAAVPDG